MPSNVYLKAPVTPQPVSDFSYEESQMITEAKCDDPFTLTTKTEVNVSEELTYVIPTVTIPSLFFLSWFLDV